ncbi:MAG TPA: hydantoinase B/oxoprolinase family protein [Gaiellaceae bacterium]|nr:hydantoinase B/oxoprolinase family protein [Gaiellaceae bacterium]
MNVELQVIGSSLRAVADEMGAVLVRSAFSPNIKERRDCSTAIFDDKGRLISQAEHIPIHLGAMPDAVAAVMELDPRPEGLYILNDPFTGGSHLPDVTLVSRTPVGFAVSRAHHADIGGMEPGSLPAFSTELLQEGLVLPPVELTEEVLQIFAANTRRPDERLGDLRAQRAAHRLAGRRLAELVERRGLQHVRAAMAELHDYSERLMRDAVARLPDGRHHAVDWLEASDGELVVRVSVEVRGNEIEIDFTGTAPQHRGNLNCPMSVTRSACYFVARCLTDPDLPASGGAFAPVRVTAPEGCLVNATRPAAVVAGNVETSSRIVDVVFAAFRGICPVPAQGQGTVNNVSIGAERFVYYETVGGGQGASRDGPGPSAVHVAISNTLNTPVEALELAYPLRVERYALRLGSGGNGERRGGDGIVREIRALEDCRCSLLTERRSRAPQGTEGGEPGLRGRNLLNGDELPAKATFALSAGDLLTIETPGGGGFGRPPARPPVSRV